MQTTGVTKIEKGGAYRLRGILRWEEEILAQGGEAACLQKCQRGDIWVSEGGKHFGRWPSGGQLKTKAGERPEAVWGVAAHGLGTALMGLDAKLRNLALSEGQWVVV